MSPFDAAVQDVVGPWLETGFAPGRRELLQDRIGMPQLAYRSHEAACRIDMPNADRFVAEWGGVRAELLRAKRGGTCECEFLGPSHVIVTHPDGGPDGCEWSDGIETRKVAPLPTGSALFNPAGRYVRMRRRVRTGAQMLLLVVDPVELDRLAADGIDPTQVEFRQNVALADPSLHRTLQAIAEETEAAGSGGRVCRESLTVLLLAQLVRCASNLARPSSPTYAKGGLASWRLRRALEMLEGDLVEGPSLSDLARHVGLHPTSFCRAFRQSTGVSPHRYLLERRVARAKKMMADQTMTLTQIALDCGFGTSSQFSVVFRRITGISPSIYRRSL